MTSVHYERLDPILRVEDMATSLRFYVDILGFERAPWGTDDFTMVSQGRLTIYLCRGDQGRGGAWAWAGVDDVGKLHADLVARGVAIKMPPTNHPWAYEMHVEDPDKNVLRFGSDPLPEK